MQVITRYQAVDGSEWDVRADAEARDLHVQMTEVALTVLGAVYPKDHDFYRGSGYMQHTLQEFLAAKQALVDVTRAVSGTWMDTNAPYPAMGRVPEWFTLMLADGSPMCKAWLRLMKIDGSCREWCHERFVEHPQAGAQASPKQPFCAGRMW